MPGTASAVKADNHVYRITRYLQLDSSEFGPGGS
jgi:hypothetical protein